MLPSIDSVPQEIATDLDQAWLNFEPDVPLPTMEDGTQHPFYIARQRDPLAELKVSLRLKPTPDSKYFVSGHRGCGKSTELVRLASDPMIKQKYLPIFFSIREEADIADLDYLDILLLIGTQMFMQFEQTQGYSLPDTLLTALDQWRGDIEEVIRRVQQGRTSGEVKGEVGAEIGPKGLTSFFGKLGGVIKVEPKIRHEIRQTLGQDTSALLAAIDLIAVSIRQQTKKWPLVLIDDLDKVDLVLAQEIFHGRLALMCRPRVPVVYTVASALYYTPEFMIGINEDAIFVPNIKLHPQGDADAIDTLGYRVMNDMLDERIDAALISAKGRGVLLRMCGGVFRELARLVQAATANALIRGGDKIEEEDAEHAAAEIRSGYWRILSAEDRLLLQQVRRTNMMEHPDKLAPLFQILAVLEYRNGERWCDVHPVLEHLLDRLAEEDDSQLSV